MKRLRWLTLTVLVLFTALGTTLSYTHSASAALSQQACDNQQSQKFLGVLPTWYEYLPVHYNATTDQCDIEMGSGLSSQYWLIGLAAIDILVRLAGFVAVIFVIYGAIRFITSQGEPENTKAARETIIHALIGVVIVLIAVPALRFIGDTLGGTDTGASSNLIPQTGSQGNYSLQTVFNAVYVIIGSLAVLMIVIAGFRYIIAGGDSQKMARAREAIIYTAVGVVVLLAATGIINFVISFFR